MRRTAVWTLEIAENHDHHLRTVHRDGRLDLRLHIPPLGDLGALLFGQRRHWGGAAPVRVRLRRECRDDRSGADDEQEASTSAMGLEISARTSRGTRRGSVVMGNVVAPPEIMKIAMTDNIGDRTEQAEQPQLDVRRPPEIEDECEADGRDRKDVRRHCSRAGSTRAAAKAGKEQHEREEEDTKQRHRHAQNVPY